MKLPASATPGPVEMTSRGLGVASWLLVAFLAVLAVVVEVVR